MFLNTFASDSLGLFPLTAGNFLDQLFFTMIGMLPARLPSRRVLSAPRRRFAREPGTVTNGHAFAGEPGTAGRLLGKTTGTRQTNYTSAKSFAQRAKAKAR